MKKSDGSVVFTQGMNSVVDPLARTFPDERAPAIRRCAASTKFPNVGNHQSARDMAGRWSLGTMALTVRAQWTTDCGRLQMSPDWFPVGESASHAPKVSGTSITTTTVFSAGPSRESVAGESNDPRLARSERGELFSPPRPFGCGGGALLQLTRPSMSDGSGPEARGTTMCIHKRPPAPEQLLFCRYARPNSITPRFESDLGSSTCPVCVG